MATIYARLFINQYKFKNQRLFSASFIRLMKKINGDEIELSNKLNNNNKLTENDIDKIDIISQLEHQIQIQENKESGWIFDKIDSMTKRFYKTGELNGSSYVKIPLRSNALINIKNNDKYCFFWSILAYLHPCENDHSYRVSNYKQYFNELNINGFDFTNGFKCSDNHKFEKLNNLSIKIFDSHFYQDKANGNIIEFLLRLVKRFR